MPRISPFRAVRFDFKRVSLSRVLCPPYDVIAAAEARRLRRGSVNAIHVELPAGAGASRFKKAAKSWKRWQDRGLLLEESRPSFYLSEERFRLGKKTLRRTGILAALGLDPSSARDVLAHEQTLPKARADRLELLKAIRANTSPIFGLFADRSGALRKEFSNLAKRPPLARGRLDSVSYMLWRVDDSRTVRQLERSLSSKKILLADGHHRFKVGRGYFETVKDPGAGSILAYFCSEEDPGLAVLPTHRVVKSTGLGQAVRGLCRLKPYTSLPRLLAELAAQKDPRAFGFFDGSFFLAVPNRPGGSRSGLGVEWINLNLLGEISKEDIRYTHDAQEAVRWAREEKSCALILKSFPASDIRKAVAKAGLLPPKSTYFYPKVPAGLVFKAC